MNAEIFSMNSPDEKLRNPLIADAINLVQPTNSAPSRLQNFETFYRDLVHFNRTSKLKTQSLTNLFVSDTDQYSCIVRSPRRCCCVTEQFTYDSVNEKMLGPDKQLQDEEQNMVCSPLNYVKNGSDVEQLVFNNQEASAIPVNQAVNPVTDNSTVTDRYIMPASNLFEAGKNQRDSIGTELNSQDSEKFQPSDVLPNAESDQSRMEERAAMFDMSDMLENLNDTVFDTDTDYGNSTDPLPTVTHKGKWSEDDLQTPTYHDKVEVCTYLNSGVRRSRSDTENDSVGNRSPVQRRKSVHFADSRGLDLEVRILFKQDDHIVPPRLKEALDKVRAEVKDESASRARLVGGHFEPHLTHFSLTPSFQQPFLNPSFQRRVLSQMVCLESVSILPCSLSLTGIVRVVNLEFRKSVFVRYTTDRWRSYKDFPASFLSSIHNFNQDQFSFHVQAPYNIERNSLLEFAIAYRLPSTDRIFWDNNFGNNYAINYIEHHATRSDEGMMT